MWRALPLLFLASLLVAPAMAGHGGVKVIVTFHNLVHDVKPLLCKGDSIDSVAPPGVDPHDYQLTPADVEKLRSADVIISTAHVPFEMRIRGLVSSGEIEARLIEIPKIPGVRLLENPETGNPNYHMPIYDPSNYKAFIEYIAKVLDGIRPECAQNYDGRAAEIVRKVNSIAAAPRLNVVAVADTPVSQYAVSWMGVKVKYLMIKEHGAPATPVDIERIISAMKSGEVHLVVVTEPAKLKASQQLLEYAKEYGIPVLEVPSPTGERSMPEKLEDIALRARATTRTSRQAIAAIPLDVRWLVVMVAAALAYGALSPLIAARRLYFLAGASPHAALLAAVAAIPAARILGILDEHMWAVLTGLALTYIVGYMIYKGVDSDTATAVFVAFTASASVAAIYYVLTSFPIESNIWAMIVGDPLLASWSDAVYAMAVAAVVLALTLLTHRENVCLGVDRDGARLSGVRVEVYDWLVFTLLALTTVALIRIVGFVLEHVLILLPSAIAVTIAGSARSALLISLAASLAASLAGLYAAVVMNQAPAAAAGLLLTAVYAASLAIKR